MARLLNMRPDVEVEPNLPAHLQHLRKENQRPRSIRERRLTVLRIARHLKHPVADVTREELLAWQDERANNGGREHGGLTAAAMHNEVVHLTQYLKWLVAAQLRAEDPSPALVRPRHVNQSMPHPMADAAIQRALEAATSPDLHAWIGLGAFCGLRCMEMAPLAREHIVCGEQPYLRIIGKGGKERAVPLPSHLYDEIMSGPFNPAGHLFNRMDGKPGPPSPMRVSERINDHLHGLGIAETAHALRHRFGTKLYEATKDPFYVAQVMGHASTDTTRGYVQLLGSKSAAIEAISRLVA